MPRLPGPESVPKRSQARGVAIPKVPKDNTLTFPITGANGIGAHLGRLAAIAKGEPELKEAIGAYMEALRGPAHPPAPRHSVHGPP